MPSPEGNLWTPPHVLLPTRRWRNILPPNDSTVSVNVELAVHRDYHAVMLRKVDFTAESGQLHVLVGPNGCERRGHHVTLVKLSAVAHGKYK
jgi:ABC-type transport system involved in cytochrome bd biosynthesis fused ATPase/permease subunit